MRKGILPAILFFFLPPILFCQDAEGIIVERNGKAIIYKDEGRRRKTIAPIFSEDGVTVNLVHFIASYHIEIVFVGGYFTDIDSVEFSVIADRTLRLYSERVNSITAQAGKDYFIDKASDSTGRNPFLFTKEYKSGKYISTFEIAMPNYKFDIFKYAKECSISFSIGGKDYSFTASPVELRTLQDLGLLSLELK
jgi:hypothetical protein